MESWKTFTFVVPYIMSFGISLGVGVYALRRKSVKGALGYAWVALGQSSSTLGYIFELVSPSIQGKIFWDDFQWFGLIGWFIGILVFVIQFTEIKLAHPKRFWFLVSLTPAVVVGLVLTNRFHGLFHANEILLPGEPFAALDYEIPIAAILFGIYGYVFVLASLFILIRKYNQSQPIYRAQTGIIFLGTVIPLVGTMLTASGIVLSFHRDYTPFTFAIGNLVVVYGIFRYQLLNIVPVAYQAVFENISDAVIVLDNQRRLVNYNSAAKSLVPSLTDDLIGNSIRQILAQSEDLVDKFQHVDRVQTEIAFPSKNGNTFLDLRISPLSNRRGDLIGRVIVARDITDKKWVEKEVRSYASELEAANKELEAFSYSVSHDLRAPLRAIKGFGEILAQEFKDKLGTQGKDYLQRILDRTEHMEVLIEDMLRLSRVTRSEMLRQRVNLSELAVEILSAHQRSVPDWNGDFEISPDLSANCDRGLITAVLENLMDNALKFTSKHPHPKIVFGAENSDGRWIFFVRDNGVGFDMIHAEKIFDPFNRVHSSDEFEGTGIGLATVQRIIRRHGGQVWAEGEVGKGATIYFTLPSE